MTASVVDTSDYVRPGPIRMDAEAGSMAPAGLVLTRRLSDLDGLFVDAAAWREALAEDDRVVYEVRSSYVPERDRELPQSITTIQPGHCGGELFMTKGHQHPNAQGEIYVGLSGRGGLLMFDGAETQWVDMEPGVIGYIPPGWAHRSVNVGDEPYRFLAVYPGGAGHDYQWVLDHGMGRRAMRTAEGHELVPYDVQRS